MLDALWRSPNTFCGHLDTTLSIRQLCVQLVEANWYLLLLLYLINSFRVLIFLRTKFSVLDPIVDMVQQIQLMNTTMAIVTTWLAHRQREIRTVRKMEIDRQFKLEKVIRCLIPAQPACLLKQRCLIILFVLLLLDNLLIR